MSIFTTTLESRWSSEIEDSIEQLVDTESFLKSALSIAHSLEDQADTEDFDEEFLAICSQCQTGGLSGHL